MRKAISKGKQLNHVPRRSARISNRQQQQKSMTSLQDVTEEPVAQTLCEAESFAEQSSNCVLPAPMRQTTDKGKQLKRVTHSRAQVEETLAEGSVKQVAIPPRRSARLQNKKRCIQESPKTSAAVHTHQLVVDMVTSTIQKVSVDTSAPTKATKRKIQQTSSLQCKRARSSRQQRVTAPSTASSASLNTNVTLAPRRSQRLRSKRRLSGELIASGPRRSRRIHCQKIATHQMTTLELRNALRQRNLKVSGLKAELQQRLHNAMSEYNV